MNDRIQVQVWHGSGSGAIRADMVSGSSAIAATGYGRNVLFALKNLLENCLGFHEDTCIRLLREQNLAIVKGNAIEWLFLDYLAQGETMKIPANRGDIQQALDSAR